MRRTSKLIRENNYFNSPKPVMDCVKAVKASRRRIVQKALTTFSVSGALMAAPTAVSAQSDCKIDNPSKIGIGAVSRNVSKAQLKADLESVNAAWYYDWTTAPKYDGANATPMVWNWQLVSKIDSDHESEFLLGFNEPDHSGQANMTVDQALGYWPALMMSGKTLGSPAATTKNDLHPNSWLGQFMRGAEERNYDVDFIAVHYYSTSTNHHRFIWQLKEIYAQYGKPIWVTEWGLADWSNPDRFSEEQQIEYFKKSAEKMDNLDFVERHAWFGLYNGQDGWDLNSGLVEKGELTKVGEAYRDLVACGMERWNAANG